MESVTNERWGVGRSLVSFIVNFASLFSKSNDTVFGQTGPSLFTSRTSAAHERMQATGVNTTNVVGVFSIDRRKRNHHDVIIRRVYFAATSARLSATKPKPPLCSKRSVALKARSTLPPQRTHNKRSPSTRALAADERSKVSLVSTSAQVSSCMVATASADSNKLVRPDDAVPWISVIDPRGNPSIRASISPTPVGTISAGCFWRRKTAPKRSASANSISFFATADFIFALSIYTPENICRE